jgi:transposase
MIEDTAAELEAVKTVVKVQRAARKPKSVKVQDLNASSLANKMDQDDEDEDDEDDDDDSDDDDEFEDEDEDDSMEHDVSNENKPSSAKKSNASDSEKLRRRLPMSIKELIDYHSGNGKSIKEIVSRINAVCRADEKVSYGYVQKYLYRKKLEATTAKKARYYRKKYGFVYRRMRRKPVLTENHKSSRISWCESHVGDHFGQDIFIGKTSLKPFLASLNQLKGQPADPNQPRQQTTLHLWGAISRKGASPLQIFDGALTTAMYLEILLENVVPFIAENFPEGHRFHQDNNPKHSAKLSQEFLESTGINWVKSPPRSHDLNPIELVWTDLIQVVAKRLPKTIGQVVVAVKEYWKTLTPEKCSEFIDKLVDVSFFFVFD